MKRFFLATALALLCPNSADAGRYFVTGHDSDFHAAPASAGGSDSEEARNIIWKSIRYVTFNKPLPRILLVTGWQNLGGDSSADPRAGLAASGYAPFASGKVGSGPVPIPPGGVPTRGFYEVAYSDAESAVNFSVSTVNLNNYDAIVVASDFGGWLRQSELDALNARAAAIQSFVTSNAKKGVVAFAESGSRKGGLSRGTSFARYAFLPGVESEVLNQHEGGIVQLNCNPVGLTQADVTANFSHAVFSCVPGWEIVEVDNGGHIITIAYDTGAQAPGALDTSFVPPPTLDSTVYALSIEPSGKILVGGVFTTPKQRVLRLLPDGTLDSSFNPPAFTSGGVYCLAQQPDGKVIVGGFFSVTGYAGQNLIRLNSDGTRDLSFSTVALNDSVRSIAVQDDGRIVIGGWFTQNAGWPTRNIARLTPAGSFDTSWRADIAPNSVVHSLLLDGSDIVIAGDFTSISHLSGTHNSSRLARLSSTDGSIDTSFSVGASLNGSVLSLRKANSGHEFEKFYLTGGGFSTPRTRVARFLDDGAATADTRFDPGSVFLTTTVYSLSVQCDGKILVGGSPSTLKRVRSDGILDTTFNPTLNSAVYATAIQVDGKVVVGGAFTTINGFSAVRIARMHGACF